MAGFLELLGWTLLHSVWQGGLVAALFWGVLQVLRRPAPATRYAAGMVALLLLIVLPLATYHQASTIRAEHRAWVTETAEGIVLGSLAATGTADGEMVRAELLRRRAATVWAPSGLESELSRSLGRAAPALGLVWLMGLLVLGCRLVRDHRRAVSLARVGRPDDRWRGLARRVAARMGVDRPVRVRVSPAVDVPVMVGWRWPVVVIPPSARLLPDTDAEAVVAHELAHVRRHDYLINVLQGVAEVLLFYNPAAWWISARVREERECCCDQTAIPVVEGGPAHYLRTLLSLELSRGPGAPRALGLPAATGGPLLRRVRRVHEATRDRRRIHWSAAAVFLMAIALSAAVLPPDGGRVAARLSAGGLVQQDLERMRLVVRTYTRPPVAAVDGQACRPTGGPRDAARTARTARAGREA